MFRFLTRTHGVCPVCLLLRAAHCRSGHFSVFRCVSIKRWVGWLAVQRPSVIFFFSGTLLDLLLLRVGHLRVEPIMLEIGSPQTGAVTLGIRRLQTAPVNRTGGRHAVWENGGVLLGSPTRSRCSVTAAGDMLSLCCLRPSGMEGVAAINPAAGHPRGRESRSLKRQLALPGRVFRVPPGLPDPGPWVESLRQTASSVLQPPPGLWAPPKPPVASEGPQGCSLCSWPPEAQPSLSQRLLAESQGDRSGFSLGLPPQGSKASPSLPRPSPTELNGEAAWRQQPRRGRRGQGSEGSSSW